MTDNNKTEAPIKVEEGATRIENRVFRILGRLAGYGTLVFYLVIILKGKATGVDAVITDFDKWLMGLSAVAVFAVEVIRYYAVKKLGS